MTTVAITGNTYPVKEQLKALGGRWNAASKAWMVPADNADAARKLVVGSPKYSSGSRSYATTRTRTGCSCGSIEEYSRDSDCASCQHDA